MAGLHLSHMINAKVKNEKRELNMILIRVMSFCKFVEAAGIPLYKSTWPRLNINVNYLKCRYHFFVVRSIELSYERNIPSATSFTINALAENPII